MINSLTEVPNYLQSLSRSTKGSSSRSLVLKCLAYSAGLEGDLLYLDVIKYARMDFKRRLRAGALDLERNVQRICDWLQKDEQKILELEGKLRKLGASKKPKVTVQTQPQGAYITYPPHQGTSQSTNASRSVETAQDEDSPTVPRENVKTSEPTNITKHDDTVNSQGTTYECIRSQLERSEKEVKKFRTISEGRADYIRKLLRCVPKKQEANSTVKAEPATGTEQVREDADERIQALESLIALEDTAVATLQQTTNEAVQKSQDAQNALAHQHGIAERLSVGLKRKDLEIESIQLSIGKKDQQLNELERMMELRTQEAAGKEATVKIETRALVKAEMKAILQESDRNVKALTKSATNKEKELVKLRDLIERKDKAIQLMKTHVARKDQRLIALKDVINARAARTMEIEADLDAKESAGIIALKASVASKVEEINQLKDLIAQKDIQNQLMRTNADNKDWEIATLKEAHDQGPAATAATKALIEAKDIEVRELQEITTGKSKELEELKQAVSQKAAETEMLWDRVAHLQGESKKRKRSD